MVLGAWRDSNGLASPQSSGSLRSSGSSPDGAGRFVSCVGFSACARCSAMRSARAFTCSGLGRSLSARSACSSRLVQFGHEPGPRLHVVVVDGLGGPHAEPVGLVPVARDVGVFEPWHRPAQLLGLLPGHLFGVPQQPAALEDVRVPGLARGGSRHVDDLLGGLKLLGAVAPPPLLAVPHVGLGSHEFSTDRCRVVGPVGFELAARVALEVAPVRLPGRFRPRLALAQLPDLGGEQLAQAVEYPAEFGADGGQQAVAAPDLTVGLAPLADASGPFDGPGRVALVDGGFEVAALVFEAPVVDSRGLVQPRVTGLRPGFAQGLELGLPVERVQGHARALPLPAAPLVGLLPAGLGVDQRHPLSPLVQHVLHALLESGPAARGRVDLPVGDEDVRVRIVALPVLVDGVGGRVAVRVQVLADVLLQRLHALPGGELARQGHDDLLGRPRRPAGLVQLDRVEQHGGVGVLGRRALRQQGADAQHALLAPVVVGLAATLVMHPPAADVRERGRGPGTARAAHVGDGQMVDRHRLRLLS